MRRSYFALVGLALLAATVGVMIAVGVGEASGTVLVAVGALLLSADLLIIGGLTDQISVNSWVVRWYHMVGAGVVLLGLANVVFGAGWVIESGEPSVGVLAFTTAGLVIAFIGVDFFRGGIHYDVSRFE